MPEFLKWVNGGKFDGALLSDHQKSLRGWYSKLIRVTQAPAFTRGEFHGLNHANKDNPAFGRVGDETASGHWLYAFLRHDDQSGQSFLVVANFHGTETLRGVKVRIPRDARAMLGREDSATWRFADRLETGWTGAADGNLLEGDGVPLPDLPPCSALLLEITG